MNSYEKNYRGMLDAELLTLAGQSESLTDEAREALGTELKRRGLREEDVLPYAEGKNAGDTSSETGADALQRENLIAVFTAGDELEARLIQELLEAAGIESVLRARLTTITPGDACEILVLKHQAAQASGIISERRKSALAAEEETEARDVESPET